MADSRPWQDHGSADLPLMTMRSSQQSSLCKFASSTPGSAVQAVHWVQSIQKISQIPKLFRRVSPAWAVSHAQLEAQPCPCHSELQEMPVRETLLILCGPIAEFITSDLWLKLSLSRTVQIWASISALGSLPSRITLSDDSRSICMDARESTYESYRSPLHRLCNVSYNSLIRP